MRNLKRLQATSLAAIVILLAGCENGFQSPFGGGGSSAEDNTAQSSSTTTLVERDVEAPEIFQATEAGLWDGRPSLGGVWVAHPDVTDPERVIIRNEENDRSVIGALFRRERNNPGPSLQVSSDAAAALNLVAGSPTTLNVTALRREEVAEPEPIAATAPATTEEAAIATSEIGAIASAAIDEAETPSTPAPQASSLGQPYIQIGIFSVEANANRTAQVVRDAGLVPTIHEHSSNGRPFWRVVVGPAADRLERTRIQETVRELGFTDAYAVRN